MTGLAYMFDAAYPPAEAPPGMAAVLGYIGGDRATNIWTLQEWQRFGHLVQIPCYVPDFTAEDPREAAVKACSEMKHLGWAPWQQDRRVIFCDLETSIERSWSASFAGEVAHQGFWAGGYGSLSTILENAMIDVIVAAWDDSATLLPGQTIHGHQYVAGVTWGGTQVDYSVIDTWLLDRGGQGPRHA